MYANVKFINDIHGSNTCNVPVSYIKNFDPFTKEFDKKIAYEVFWSPNEEDTPNCFSPKKQTKDATPSAGFYKATILQVADTEELLEELLESRRVKIVPEKCLKSPAMTKPVEEETKKVLKKTQKAVSAKGKNFNTKKLNEIKIQNKPPAFKKSQANSLFGSSDSSDDEVIPKKMLLAKEKDICSLTSKHNELRKKYESVKIERDRYKNKCSVLMNKLTEVETLNHELQKEVIQKIKNINEKIDQNTEVKVIEGHSPVIKRKMATALPYKRALPFDSETASSSSTSQNQDVQMQPTKKQKNTGLFELHSPFKYMITSRNETTVITEDTLTATEGGNTKEITEEDQLAPVHEEVPVDKGNGIDKERLAAAKLNAKFGVAGDSQFAKNLASIIWMPHVLAQRSVSGRSKKGRPEEKKALTPSKMDVLKGAFKERLLQENPAMPEVELRLRMKNVTRFITEKIMTLNRVSKLDQPN